MKKLLLLLMAVLLFTPPRAKAETAKFFDNTISVLEKADITYRLMEDTTKTVKYDPKVNKVVSNIYDITIDGKYHIKYTFPNFDTEGTKLSGISLMSHATAATWRYIFLSDENNITISVDGGSINKLTVMGYSRKTPNASAYGYTNTSISHSMTCNYKPAESVGPKGKYDPYYIKDNVTREDGTVHVQFKSSTTSYNGICITGIEIEYEPLVCDPPLKPKFDVKQDENLGFNFTPNADGFGGNLTFASVPLLSKNLIGLSTEEEGKIELYYTYNKDIPTPDGAVTATSGAKDNWVKATPGEGLHLLEALPSPNDLKDAEHKFIIRAVAFRQKVSEEETVVNATFKRPAAPTVDLEKTIEANKNSTGGSVWLDQNDPRKVYYGGFNPVLVLKTSLPVNGENGYVVKYTTDFTRPLGANGQTYDKEISIVNGTVTQKPVVGYDNTIYVKSYVDLKETSTGTAQRYEDYYPSADYAEFHLIRQAEGGITSMPAPRVENDSKVKTVTLSGDATGFIADELTVTLKTTLSDINNVVKVKNMQYQWCPADNDVWVQTPNDVEGVFDESLGYIPDGTWKNASGGVPSVQIKGTGRLFVREKAVGSDLPSEWTFYDYKKLDVTPIETLDYDELLKIDDASTAVKVDVPVRLIGSFALNGENSTTAGNNVYLMFFADKEGNVLRVHNEAPGANPYPYDKCKYRMFKDLTGVIRKNKGMPELYLNTPSLDYSQFLDGGANNEGYNVTDLKELPADYPMYAPKSTDKVPEAKDYSKLMYFGPMRWNKKNNEFTDNFGGTVKLYSRIVTEIDKIYGDDDDKNGIVNLEESLADGVQYRIAGYVGYADGAYVIMPRAIVAAPRLLAPNPINPDAAPNQLIKMDVVSDELSISVNTEGLSDQAKLFHVTTHDVNEWLTDGKFDPSKIKWVDKEGKPLVGQDIMSASAATNGNNEIFISNDDLTGENTNALAVKLSRDGFESAVVGVKFIKHETTPVHDIAEFKEELQKVMDNFDDLPLNTQVIDVDHKNYFRYDGLARVREVTPHYLYIRTTPGDGSNLDADADLSAHSMLLYNKDGWDAPIAGIIDEEKVNTINPVADGDEEEWNPEADLEPRKLKQGDVITNFALIPTRSKFGNLIGQSTGFTLTFRRVANAKAGGNDPLKLNAQDQEDVKAGKVGFTESDRMLRYKVISAKVGRKVVDETKNDNDPTKYEYYIDMPGKPVLNVRDVFEPINGWDMAWDAEAYYELTGVVMLADRNKQAPDEKAETPSADGRYMLALIEYSQPGVTPADDPVVVLEGAGTDQKNLTFLTTAQVKIGSKETNSTDYNVYYTTDGTDPETSETAIPYVNGEPFTLNANTTIKAFVVAKGHPNSNVVEFNLTRLASDRRYIVDFVNNTKKDTPYNLTATARVVAKGGEYAFIRGGQGNYLPIHFEDAEAKAKMPEVDDYIGQFVAKPYLIDVEGVGQIMRGAHVTNEYAGLFTGKITKPASLGDDEITAEPDIVDNITPAHARRYVKILNVKLEGEAFEDEEIATAANTQWVCTTEKGEGKKIEINHNVLEPNFDWDSSDDDPAACYNIIGFVRLGDDGEVELWPTEVEKVRTSAKVTATFSVDGEDTEVALDEDNAYTVKFKKHSVVTLSSARGTTIYYYISTSDDEKHNPAPTAKWNVYAQPFSITGNCYIHAYSVAPGYEAGSHTHFYMTKLEDEEKPEEPTKPGVPSDKVSGKVKVNIDSESDPKKVIVTIVPAGIVDGDYEIFYSLNADEHLTPENGKLYTGPIELTEGARLMAILVEKGKAAGELADLFVIVTPAEIDGIDADRAEEAVIVSGNDIVAPEGSMVFDLMGRRVNREGLRAGIYIVRTPAGKAMKVQIR